jgi:hypothetical protein
LVCHSNGGTLTGSDNETLRKKSGPKKDGVTKEKKNYILQRFIICALHATLFRLIKSKWRSVGHAAFEENDEHICNDQ